MRGLDTYNPDYPFPPWLWKVARNLWIEWTRRYRRSTALSRCAEMAGADDPFEEACMRELGEHLERALEQLCPAQQQIVRLAMAGASAETIASNLGLKKLEVFRLLFRARRALEKQLDLGTGGPELS
jgi:RNA polymerase sigma factor (sigma-70 family)